MRIKSEKYDQEQLVRTNLCLPDSVHKALKHAAADRKMSMEQIVLKAVETELAVPSSTTAKGIAADKKLKAAIKHLKALTLRLELAVRPEGPK